MTNELKNSVTEEVEILTMEAEDENQNTTENDIEKASNWLADILYSDPKDKEESADIIKRIFEDIFEFLSDSDEEDQKEDNNDK
jgi:hypothetical protein